MFHAGLVSLWIALASPIDALDDYLLAAHMIQHFILMSIAPPLVVLGAPMVPLLRGLPAASCLWLAAGASERVGFIVLARLVAHPVAAWLQ